MSEKPLHYIKSVEYLPSRNRVGESFYDEIIREFLYSGVKYAEVKDIGKKPLAIMVSLRSRLIKRKEKVHVLIRKGKVYLARDEPEKQIQSETIPEMKPLQTTISNKNNYDVVKVLDNTIVKARCPRCQTLNSKGSKICRDCNHNIYPTEMEYRNSLREMETLEKTINC